MFRLSFLLALFVAVNAFQASAPLRRAKVRFSQLHTRKIRRRERFPKILRVVKAADSRPRRCMGLDAFAFSFA